MADACCCLTVAWPPPDHEREDRHERGCDTLSGHSRGGRFISRPRAFPQRRIGAPGRRAVADEAAGTPKEVIRAGLSDEIKYIAPLTVAGIIVLSGGPIALTVAALVGAGLGGAALKELFDDYTASHHSEDFEAALKGGAALLWVRCPDPDSELAATRILEEAGGRNVHVHGRAPRAEERSSA